MDLTTEQYKVVSVCDRCCSRASDEGEVMVELGRSMGLAHPTETHRFCRVALWEWHQRGHAG